MDNMTSEEAPEGEAGEHITGTDSVALGTFICENWKNYNEITPIDNPNGVEVPLFSDTMFTGQIDELGPYSLINMVPDPKDCGHGKLRVVLVLRYFFPESSFDLPMDWEEATDVSRYHGGYIAEEISGLLSLIFGVKIKAGQITRDFGDLGGRRGRPRFYTPDQEPSLAIRTQNPMLPKTNPLTPCVNDAKALLNSLLSLNSNDSIALVRAARLYQDAMWIADSEPSLSWISFVSAIEVAADCFAKNQVKDDSVELLKMVHPPLYNIVAKKQDEKLLKDVAKSISRILGAMMKFQRFIERFAPSPPDNRPSEWAQFEWENLLDAASTIYKHRSVALHGDTPFPQPMCNPPSQLTTNQWAEKPLGEAVYSKGGSWIANDYPMHLFLFEYIIRNSLLKWWQSLIMIEPSHENHAIIGR